MASCSGMEAESSWIQKIFSRFGGDKADQKFVGGAKRRIKRICAGPLVLLTAVCDLLMLLGYLAVSLICHCVAAVLYLWPTNFISKIARLISVSTNKVFAVLRESSRALAEINRTLAEINRTLAEINRCVAVLREIASGRCLLKFVIALFLMYVCILYLGSPPHVPQVSVRPQTTITKDLIVNITFFVRDSEGFLVRREFVCFIAIALR